MDDDEKKAYVELMRKTIECYVAGMGVPVEREHEIPADPTELFKGLQDGP
jgi:hypothetical protein